MKKYSISFILFVTIVSSLIGCTNTIRKPNPPITLTLIEPVYITAYSAQVMIQNGKIKSDMAINQYAPYCRLEMKSQKNYSRTIKPDTFVVNGISKETNYVMNDSINVASLGFMFASGVTDEIYSTTLYLRSATQPDVELITCEWWEDPEIIGARHLTMQEIKQTLAPLIQLKTDSR